jgi:hypothetical protein
VDRLSSLSKLRYGCNKDMSRMDRVDRHRSASLLIILPNYVIRVIGLDVG